MEGKKRIAVCQMTATGDREKNMSIVSNLIENASKENAQMIFFPEACDFLCDNKNDMFKFSEPLVGGSLMNQYRELAKKHNVWLSMGGLHEKDNDNERKVFNTHVIINNIGDIVQTYRKLHLFDVEIPEKNVRLKESDYANGGHHLVLPIQSPVGNIGMAICYDMRFPEFSTQLAKYGAHVLTFPSAFTYATGQAHWETLLRCRAIENQCFVIAAAQVGQHNPKRRSFGHAMCVDPWGQVLSTCGDKSDEPCYAIADLDYDRLEEVRRNMPVFQHRRNDVYNIFNQNVRKVQLKEHQTAVVDSPAVDDSKCVADSDDVEEMYYDFSDIKIRPSTVFFVSELSYAFVNIRCVVPGHVLVAPKRKAKRSTDLTPEEASDFFHTVIKVQKVMEEVHQTNSSTVTIQDGPDAGQTVEHVHCHVMPRRRGDFKDVDLIYLELAKHDARPARNIPTKPPRTLDEMREEAAILRKYFTSN
ncbi:ntrilase and fragile histidine triad fusion protein NitFhit isoform X2 [Arctopsyche grandis]